MLLLPIPCMEFFRNFTVALLLTYVLLILPRAAFGRFVVEKSSLSVLFPYSLRSQHDGAISNFGVPDYGASMGGSVVYPPKGQLGCEPFEGQKPFKSTTAIPIVLLLDRGGCYFALKVWNAQQAGAAAVLMADNVDEPLITMISPEESSDEDGYVEKIGIPSALIKRSFGESLKKALRNREDVILKLDWTESMPHPDERVEYELWINGNDECGLRCNEQLNFIKNFKGHAQILEKGGYTHFTPHYITWFCALPYTSSSFCRSQCINHGRYCALDPEEDLGRGYEGKDVVLENLRQLCVHRVANESNRSWIWWDFVTDFHTRCSMKNQSYSKTCAENVMKSLNLNIDKINKCMGNPEADMQNSVLKVEQDLLAGQGSRGDITIMPTIIINGVQYRGKLGRTAVLKAICAGFKESTDPPICLSTDLETNQCLEGNGGCWLDPASNMTACKDTYRGRVCECPVANGVEYKGDGYTSCEPFGPARCTINNGGCWSQTRKGKTLSACSEFHLSGCQCPSGFRGDGHKCEDIDECKEGLACQCDGCTCKNRWGGYDCKCNRNRLYLMDQDTCIETGGSRFGWFLVFLVSTIVAGVSIAGYVFYKYRLRSYMDSEITAIMSQYMPLDNKRPNEIEIEAEAFRL